jgi:DNA-binding ferritin-like protein
MGVYFYMEQEFSDMTKLQLDVYVSILKVRKVHFEIELAQFTKVMSYINEEMEGFNYIMDNIKKFVDIILKLDNELTKATKWQR